MSNVPLPRPGPLGLIQYAGSDMQEYAAAVSAAKDAEIVQLRAELLKSLADNAALRKRVRELTTQAMFNTSTIERLRAEVAGMREALTRLRKWGDMGAGYNAAVAMQVRDWIDAGMTGDLPAMPEWAVDREVAVAARKGEA